MRRARRLRRARGPATPAGLVGPRPGWRHRRGAARSEIVTLRVTATTRDLVQARNLPPDLPRSEAILHGQPISEPEATSLDLGGRTVTIAPSSGHTASDVTVDVPDAGVLFCGDLVWNAMFPNYVDARPARRDSPPPTRAPPTRCPPRSASGCCSTRFSSSGRSGRGTRCSAGSDAGCRYLVPNPTLTPAFTTNPTKE